MNKRVYVLLFHALLISSVCTAGAAQDPEDHSVTTDDRQTPEAVVDQLEFDDIDISDVEQAVETVIGSIHQAVPAKQINQAAPVFPQLELRRGREAWVHLTYCINEEGTTQNISVLDSVGTDAFEKAAIKTVQKWEFEPALQDGKPVWQSRNEIYIQFALSDSDLGASRKFATRFRRMSKLIEEQKFQEADELFWEVYRRFDLSLYELAKLWAQRVRYEAAVGDTYKLHMALSRATASDGKWIDSKSYIRLLEARTRVELKLGRYHDARGSFRELIDATSETAEEVVALKPTFENLHSVIESDAGFRIKAEVRQRYDCAYCSDSWHFTPVRNDFTFTNVVGALKSIDMRCDHKRFEALASELVDWHIDDRWGTCHIQVYGEPGTTFDVVMLPPRA